MSSELDARLTQMSVDRAVRSNCAFQLALMVARIALETRSEAYKEESAHVLMDLIRSKPSDNVVHLFGTLPKAGEAAPRRPTHD